MVAFEARVGVVPEAAGWADVVGAGAVVPEVFAVDVVNFVLMSFTDFSNHSSALSSFLVGEGKGWRVEGGGEWKLTVVRGTTASGAGTKSVRANVGWAVVTSCDKPVTPHPSQMVVSSLQSGHGFVCGTPGRAGQNAKDASGMLHTMHSGCSSRSSRSRFIGVP